MIYEIGEVLRLKKAHPCGGDLFKVVASASDVKLECMKCGHRLIFPIDKLSGRVKRREGTVNGKEQDS